MKRLFVSIFAITTLVISCLGQTYSKEKIENMIDSIEIDPDYVEDWVSTELSNYGRCSDLYLIKVMMNLYDETHVQALGNINRALRVVNKKSVYPLAKLLCVRAYIYTNLMEYDLAQYDYDDAVQASPKDADVLNQRAEFLEEIDEYELAEADYRKVDKMRGSVESKLALEKCLMKQMKYDEALAIVNKIIHDQPKEAEPYDSRAWLNFLNDSSRLAIDDYMTYVILDGNYEFRMLIFYCMLDMDYAIQRLSQMIMIEPDSRIWIAARIRLYIANKQYDLALKDIDALEASDEPIIFSVYQRAECYYHTQQYDKQVECLLKVIEMEEEDLDPQVLAECGMAYRHCGDMDAAMNYLNQALAVDSTYMGIYLERGFTYDMLGKKEEALADYEQALSYNDNNFFGLQQRGKIYLSNGNTEAAYRDFEKIIELDTLYATRAFALGLVGRVEEGLEFMEKAEENIDDPMTKYYNIACLYALVNRTEEALEALQKSIDAGYKDYYHMMYDPDLNSLHNTPGFLQLLKLIDPKK